jgi:hypothetical protein
MTSEVELTVMRLPSRPLFYEHVLNPLAKKDDDFVARVLARALELKVPFVIDKWDKKKLTRPFVTQERGVEVFKQWLRFPCVQDFLAKTPRVVAKIGGFTYSWSTLAHALVQKDRPELRDALIDVLPVYKDCKVRIIENLSSFCNQHSKR